MTTPNIWTILVKLHGLELRTGKRHPEWLAAFTVQADRIRRVAADKHCGRVDILDQVDAELLHAEADLNKERGAWLEEQLLTFKCGLLTDDERRELQELADRIAATMARCPVCTYGEPTAHTCDELQRRQYALQMQGERA